MTTNTPRHTPRPWRIGQTHAYWVEILDDVTHEPSFVVGRAERRFIYLSKDASPQEKDAATERSRGEMMANARLIAAAPDLFGAAKALAEHNGAVEYDNLRAAIAQAEA